MSAMDLARSFPPIAHRSARVVILGSMPGVASLIAGQYYAHPRNAFWPIMGELFDAGPELPYRERCRRLRHARIAVWDVLGECHRVGSLDADIERATERPNDFASFFSRYVRIERIYFNGQKAQAAFRRHVLPSLEGAFVSKLELIRLPSTSPAHAGMSFQEKAKAWGVIKRGLSSSAEGE